MCIFATPTTLINASMEDFGDYIYLIAIVIAGLSSLLKKKKPAENQQESNMPDLDDVIPDFGEEEEEYVPQSEPVFTSRSDSRNENSSRSESREEYVPRSEPVFTTRPGYREEATVYRHEPSRPDWKASTLEKVPVSYETVADYMKLRAKKTIHSIHHSMESAPEIEEVQAPEFEIELDSADDVKRAFVYSEIFNRKY